MWDSGGVELSLCVVHSIRTRSDEDPINALVIPAHTHSTTLAGTAHQTLFITISFMPLGFFELGSDAFTSGMAYTMHALAPSSA